MQIYFSMEGLPEEIFGAVFQIPENKKDPETYVVFINKGASVQKQRHAFGHELAHVFLGHFRTDDPLTIDPKKRKVLHHGVEISSATIDPATSKSEEEANAHAWEFYRRYKPTFARLREYGTAFLKR